ncbi:MAG: TIGR03960 family B12-binding radical SAM protein [Chloroflexia bacterium]|nr:TIGR03960 family B12-binding radical SAM protein [Chloroflexia bacterium]
MILRVIHSEGQYRLNAETLSAWLEHNLLAVQRPTRYSGGEWNSRQADWPAARIRVALAYPDLYDVGMANLGLQILYDRLNRLPGVLAERVYAPWPDMEAAMRRDGIPLYGLESRHPLGEFDLIGFSLPYELTYSNVLNMLDLAGLPLFAKEREAAHPLVIAGGSAAYHPEPLADFIDLFVLGEGEEVLEELVGLLIEARQAGATREQFLRRAAQLQGIYVPRFYEVTYHPDGTLAAVQPRGEDIPQCVSKRLIADLVDSPTVTRPVMAHMASVQDRAVVEIQRGCSRGCRFCQAGMIYRPVRERSPEEVRAAAAELLAHTGYGELALLSFSASDYRHIRQLLQDLADDYRELGLSLSLPSLRLDSFSVDLAEIIAERRRTGLTFAPEAGTQRLRDIINKGLTEEDFRRTLEAAFSRGWHRVKLYFMIGLPSETEADLQGIVDMVHEAQRIGREHAGRRVRIAVSISHLVPKPHTPFQWLGQADPQALEEKVRFLRQSLRSRFIEFSWHDIAASRLEAAFARGDRRLSGILLEAWRAGARFDAWHEHFEAELWWTAFRQAGLDPAFYAQRERSQSELLPWDHLSCGVANSFLWREYQRGLRGETTPDCRLGVCTGCGVQRIADCPTSPPSPAGAAGP